MSLGTHRRWVWLLACLLAVLGGCGLNPPADQPATRTALHLRVLSTHDFHGTLSPVTHEWSAGRPVGGVAALKAAMDDLEQACACPTIRLDAGDEMQGSLESNLTYGAPVVAAFNYLGLDAAAVGNHDLDWGTEMLLARQQQAKYHWLAANVFAAADGRRPAWATPFVVIERGGIRVGVVGYATVETPQIVPAAVRNGYVFRAGYAGIRAALDAVWQESPDFVIVVAHAAGECDRAGCAGEMVELASELPPGRVHLIVSGHTHEPATSVVNSIPIVRAGAYGSTVGVTDLYRLGRGEHAFTLDRQSVFADAYPDDPQVAVLLEPFRRAADARGKEQVTILAEPLSRSPTGDRRLGRLISDSIRVAAQADIGLHNPGGTRASLTAGPVTYMDIYRVMPFDNSVMRVTLTGRQLRQLVAQAGPLYYYSNLLVSFRAAPTPGAMDVELGFPDGRPVRDEETYSLATSDFLAEGGDGLAVLATLPRVAAGVTVRDAIVERLRSLPVGSTDLE